MDNSLHWLDTAPYPDETPYSLTPDTDRPIFTTEHHQTLLDLKGEIDKIQTVQTWDTAKKITNPYEYIFLSLQKRTYRSISAVIPLSRSYFKMIELWELLELEKADPFLTAHSAEGPGGFLEAIIHRTEPIPCRMIAMTLRSTEKTIPGWRKSQQFLSTYPNVLITYGADNTGNLYSLANQESFKQSAHKHIGKAHLYTADGGFDFSADFNAQENTVQRLLAAEGLCGLNTLRIGGTMILKLFDTTYSGTLNLLWLLSGCFEKTALVKPLTSRPANSERYWIGYRLNIIPPWVIDTLKSLTECESVCPAIPYKSSWLEQLKSFQTMVESHQISNIQLTLNLINHPTKALIQSLLLSNIKSSRVWCTKYNIPINRQYTGFSDEQIMLVNLEEALEPFLTSVSHKNSPGPFRPSLTRHESFSSHSLPPPTGLAWRSALPASVLGREPLKTVLETAPSDLSSQTQFLP